MTAYEYFLTKKDRDEAHKELITRQIVAIIPSKLNSERIERKNLLPIHGEPLVDRAVAAAASALVNEIIVTSDSPVILERFAGQNVIAIKLPPDYTRPGVQVAEVVSFVLGDYGNNDAIAVILQPTSPFRTAHDINEALRMYWLFSKKNDNTRNLSVMSGYLLDKFTYENRGAYLTPINHNPKVRLGGQYTDEHHLFVENGAVYVASVEAILRHKTFRTPNIVPYYMSVVNSVEIDEYKDIEIAEAYAMRGVAK